MVKNFFKILFILFLFAAVDIYADKRTITLAFPDQDMPPVFYRNPENKSGYSGLFYEILNACFEEKLNIKINYKGLPWKRAQREVENGDADFLLSVPAPARLEYSVQSDTPLFQLFMYIYTYKGHDKLEAIKKIKTAEDIHSLGLKAVTNLGNEWHKENIEKHGVETHYVPEDWNIIKFLTAKRADIMIDAPITMNCKIRQMGMESEIELTDVKFPAVKYYILISKKSEFISIMPEINKAIKEMINDGTLESIISKYTKLE